MTAQCVYCGQRFGSNALLDLHQYVRHIESEKQLSYERSHRQSTYVIHEEP